MSIQVLQGRLRAALGALCVASSAIAPIAAEASEWNTRLWTGFEFQGETDLDGPGEFDYGMFVLGGRSSGPLDERLGLVLRGDYRLIGYEFDNLGFDPWETVHVLRMNPSLQVRLDDTWSLLGGPIFEFSGETDADGGDSLRGGASFGVTYRRDENLQITFGLIVQSQIEDDAYVAPLIHFEWGIVDDLRLSIMSESSRGGELRLGYRFLEDFEVAIGGGFRRERFRLNDDRGPGPQPFSRRDGVGEEEASVLNARFIWDFMDPLQLEAYIGSTIDGEFRLENKRGDKIADADYDDAVYGGMRLGVRF